MNSYIAIDASFHWIRTALIENGLLTDVYEESPEKGRLKGNVYKGVVRRVDAKIHAAFIRYGQGRDGFLPLKDAERAGQDAPLKEGDEILVQVLKDEVGEKGAALTTRISLSGRALVYLPEKDGEGGVSSRLGDEDRARLREVLQGLKIPAGASVILRTAALSKQPGELQDDLDRLALLDKEIRDGFARRRDAGLLWREAPPITRYLREYWQKSFAKVMVNTEEAYVECRNFFTQHEPEDLHKVELSEHGPALFERLGLEETLAKLESPKVTLPSGANIVIERTEALVSIDVNSARSKGGEAGQEPEENLFRINCEAAAEVARQIRLRDLGGIIVVDFIDMEEAKHRGELEALMKSLCARDKAKVKVYGLSPLGLMEINRQRLRKIPETRELPACPQCQGTGRQEAGEGAALKALRLLAARLSERPGQAGATLSLPADAAARLWNEYRQDLEDLEQRFGSRIRLHVGLAGMAPSFYWTAGSSPAGAVAKGGGRAVKPAAVRGSGEKAAKLEKAERADKGDKFGKLDKLDKGDKGDRSDKVERAPKPEPGEGHERTERGDRNERSGRSQSRDGSERGRGSRQGSRRRSQGGEGPSRALPTEAKAAQANALTRTPTEPVREAAPGSPTVQAAGNVPAAGSRPVKRGRRRSRRGRRGKPKAGAGGVGAGPAGVGTAHGGRPDAQAKGV